MRYDCVDGQYAYDQDGIRTLQQIRLFEISLVSVPANPNALITDVKSLDEARRIIRDASVNPDAVTLAQLRSISEDLASMLDADDEDEADQEEIAAQKETVLILRRVALELKGYPL